METSKSLDRSADNNSSECKLTDIKDIHTYNIAKNIDYSRISYHRPVYISGKDKSGNRIVVVVSHRMNAFLDKELIYLYFFSQLATIVYHYP